MVACAEGHAEAAKVLIDAGTDRGLRNKKRQTAADIAAASGNARLVDLLR
jgi:ankyrin repeat protein